MKSRGQLIFLSAERAENPPRVNDEGTRMLGQRLATLGALAVPVRGVYKGCSESAFMILGLTLETAVELAGEYGQESLLAVDPVTLEARLVFPEDPDSTRDIGRLQRVHSTQGLDAYTELAGVFLAAKGE